MAKVLGGLCLIALTACAAPRTPVEAGADALPPRSANTLRLASHNVHFIRLDQASGPWSRAGWEGRKHALDAAFKALDADIVAFQEVASLPEQGARPVNLALDWLSARNPDYGVAASGRDVGLPSGQPVFYRKDRLRLLDQGWFDCDEEDDDDDLRRGDQDWTYYCVWARFATREGRQFQLYNVHFHYSDPDIQLQGARAVAARAIPDMGRGLPVFVLGDTNALSGWRSVKILRRAGLSIREAVGASFHFNCGLHLYGAIDRIAYCPRSELVGGPWLVDQKFDDHWPSDHYPIVADFRLTSP